MAKISGIGCSSSHKPAGADQRQAGDVVRREGRHLARDHAAHGDGRPGSGPSGPALDHVPGVQREVEHVAQLAAFLAVAIAGQQRRIDVEALGQRVQETDPSIAVRRRRAGRPAAGPSRLRNSGPGRAWSGRFSSSIAYCPPRPRGLGSRPARLPGVARLASGLHQKRSSSAYSGNMLRSFGITFSANSLRRIHALVVRHVADMHEAEDVADVQALDQILHALAHGLRAAGDDVAAVDQVLPGQFVKPPRGGAYCDRAPVWMVLMVR